MTCKAFIFAYGIVLIFVGIIHEFELCCILIGCVIADIYNYWPWIARFICSMSDAYTTYSGKHMMCIYIWNGYMIWS